MSSKTPNDSDPGLLQAYREHGDERAFSQLVRRYLKLVFGTALRVTVDRPAAEEVAQNVFLQLARKADQLRREGCLAGWLHRAAVLEARHRLRSDRRRQAWEEHANQLGTTMNTREAPHPLLDGPLDEALQELPQPAREVLLLRYYQGLRFRDLARELGLSEDAAQKRTSRALETLVGVLRRKGFVSATTTSAAACMESAALMPAPAHLFSVISAAVLTSGPVGSSAFMGLVHRLLSLPQAPLAAACLLVGGISIVYHGARNASSRDQLGRIQARSEESGRELEALRGEEAKVQQLAALSREALAESRARLRRATAALEDSRTNGSDPAYPWSETSEFVRISKAIAPLLHFAPATVMPQSYPPVPFRHSAVEEDGTLSEPLADALGLTPDQLSAVASAFATVHDQYQEQVLNRAVVTDQVPPDVPVREGAAWALVTPTMADLGQSLRRGFEETLRQAVGVERASLLRRQAESLLRTRYNELGALERVEVAVLRPGGLVDFNYVLRRPGEGAFEWGQSSGPADKVRLPQALRALVLGSPPTVSPP